MSFENDDNLEALFDEVSQFDDEMSDIQEVSHLNLVVFVLDGSSSMKNIGKSPDKNKSIEVKDASNAFLGRLAGSSARKSFYVGGVAFSEETQKLMGYNYVSLETLLGNNEIWGNLSHEITDEDLFNRINVIDSPVKIAGGGRTNVTLALEHAERIADAFMNDETSDEAFENIGNLHRSVVIFLLSDGKHNLGDEPYRLAGEINAKYPICTINYGGNKANEEMLKEIAQSSSHYLETDNPELLREFFTSSTAILMAK